MNFSHTPIPAAILAAALIVLPTPVAAQDILTDDPLIIKDGDRIGISGVVIEVAPKKFRLQSGESTIDVRIDSDANLSRILREGMQVYAEGDMGKGLFNDPVVRADELRIVGYVEPDPPVIVFPPSEEE